MKSLFIFAQTCLLMSVYGPKATAGSPRSQAARFSIKRSRRSSAGVSRLPFRAEPKGKLDLSKNASARSGGKTGPAICG